VTSYPASFDIERPERFQRAQLFLRILVLVLLGIVSGSVGAGMGFVYLLVPVVAALLISQKGGERFITEDATRATRWLRWLVALYAYLAFLTDRFPSERVDEIVRFDVRASGSPTVGSALLRLLKAIPSAIVLALLSLVSLVVWLIAAISILINESYPEGLFNFQRGIVRWYARLLAYLASLAEPYPPFSFDRGAESPPAVPPST
jgi:hypothetical protein